MTDVILAAFVACIHFESVGMDRCVSGTAKSYTRTHADCKKANEDQRMRLERSFAAQGGKVVMFRGVCTEFKTPLIIQMPGQDA